MLRPHALNLQRFRQLVETAVQVAAELHEVLDVVHIWEVDLHSWSVGNRLNKKIRPAQAVLLPAITAAAKT